MTLPPIWLLRALSACPPMNFLHVTVSENTLKGEGFDASLREEEQHLLAAYQQKEIVLGVRPEDLAEGDEIPVEVMTNENLGMNTLVHGYIGGQRSLPITAKLRGWKDYHNGDGVRLKIIRKHFFDAETTEAIRKE